MLPVRENEGRLTESAARVARHRLRAAASGMQRLEVSIPRADAPLIRTVARTLRDGGSEAAKLRRTLADAAPAPVTRTGAELWAGLRSGPLFDVELDVRREKTDRTPVVFE